MSLASDKISLSRNDTSCGTLMQQRVKQPSLHIYIFRAEQTM